MKMNYATLIAAIGGSVSTLLIGLGTYFPWIRVKPGLPANTPIPSVYISGMTHGFEDVGALLLVLLFMGFVVILFVRSARKTALVMFAVGLVTTAASVQNLVSSGYAFGVFVPAIGAYVTLSGGIGLILSAGVEFTIGTRGIRLS